MKGIFACIVLLFFSFSLGAEMIVPQGERRMKIFYTMTDLQGGSATLRGKVVSYSAKGEFDEKDLFGKAQDKSRVTVRLYSTEGIKQGDILYIINDQNLVVAKLEVGKLFKSDTFGDMLVGYGNFRMGSIGDRVVRRAEDEDSRYSYIRKARGDYQENIGNEGEAIMEYNKALKLDRNNPSAHLGLGLIYKRQGLEQFAAHEFQEGYKFINQIYDNDDKFQLLENLAEIRYKQVYESFISNKLRIKYRDEGIRYSSEALRIYPESGRINYILGVFYSRWENPDDKKARDCFLRVVEIDNSNADAFVALSKLYYKHDNVKKARLYAEKAIEADARNESAHRWLKKIEENEQLK